MTRHGPIIAACLCAALALPAFAQEAGPAGTINLELNKLEPVDGACRAYVVLKSQSESSFEALKLDLVMFDGDGIVAQRIAVEGAPLPAGKTALRVFDVQGQACEGIGSILLNDVLECRNEDGAVAGCLGMVETYSRASADLIN